MNFFRKIYKVYIKSYLPKPLSKGISSFIGIFQRNYFKIFMDKALKNWNRIWLYSNYPYHWANEYKPESFSCEKDESCCLFFVENQGLKLYITKDYNKKEQCKFLAAFTAMEQDLLSPHRYVSKENKMFGTIERKESEIPEETPFFVEKGDIVADIGASNGNFSISVIENAKHIYLFEGYQKWNEPLQKTFEKYKDKITIVNKYVSNVDGENSVTLDTFFKDKEVNFIKIDIEGYERKLLDGAKNILQRNNVKFSICTYHKPQDAEDFKNFFRELGYKTYFTDGCIFFPYLCEDGDISLNASMQNMNYFRKTVLRAKKEVV